jgi:hypothetical protein
MRRALVAILAGVCFSALIVLVGAVLAFLDNTIARAITTAVTYPGTLFSAAFSYGTCPLFKKLFAWSGPGGAYMQILFVSFLTWAIVFAVVSYVFFARLKRLLSFVIALFGALVALALYWIVFMPWLHLPFRSESWMKLVVALIGLTFAIYLSARRRSWPAVLFLLGSIPVVLVNISMVGWEWRMQRIDGPNPRGDSALLVFLFPSDNEHSPMNTILHYLFFLSDFCLPIAFSWYFFRVIARHVTTSPRPQEEPQ